MVDISTILVVVIWAIMMISVVVSVLFSIRKVKRTNNPKYLLIPLIIFLAVVLKLIGW